MKQLLCRIQVYTTQGSKCLTHTLSFWRMFPRKNRSSNGVTRGHLWLSMRVPYALWYGQNVLSSVALSRLEYVAICRLFQGSFRFAFDLPGFCALCLLFSQVLRKCEEEVTNAKLPADLQISILCPPAYKQLGRKGPGNRIWHASNAHWVAGNHLLSCSLDFGREGQFAGPRFPAESLPTYPGSKEYGEQKRLSKEQEWARKQDGISISMAEFHALITKVCKCASRGTASRTSVCVCVCVVCECVWRCLLIFHGGICCMSLSLSLSLAIDR